MGISRSAYYDAPVSALDDTAIVQAMGAICDEFERYGWRRVQAALRQQGVRVNHKKVKRLMREHDLQPRIRRRYVATTDSDQAHHIFRNLAKDKVVTGVDQLWVADITYVPVPAGFTYVAVILDAWSRRVVGYAIGRSIDVRLTLAALNAAIEGRRPPPGCLHHSDRGSQGGFKRSSQHLNEGGCDDAETTPIRPLWPSAAAIAGTAGGRGAISTPAILVGDCSGHDQRRCCTVGGCVAACRNQDVPKGGWHGASNV